MADKLHNVPECEQPRKWREMDAERQEALIEWYNTRAEDITAEDLEILADVRFRYWHCPVCHDFVMEGDPEHWGGFQGVSQNDRVSFPGNGPSDKRCDHCRCYDQH